MSLIEGFDSGDIEELNTFVSGAMLDALTRTIGLGNLHFFSGTLNVGLFWRLLVAIFSLLLGLLGPRGYADISAVLSPARGVLKCNFEEIGACVRLQSSIRIGASNR